MPESIAYRPTQASNSFVVIKQAATTVAKAGNLSSTNGTINNSGNGVCTTGDESNNKKVKASASPSIKTKTISNIMPLISFLRDGALNKDVGWHRQAERRARGMFPCSTLSSQLEPWEKQLALVEILLLSGGTPHANFRDLAHAWGREKGFHQVLASSICTRRGEVDRKRRSDAGGGRNKNSTRSSTRQKTTAKPKHTPLAYSGSPNMMAGDMMGSGQQQQQVMAAIEQQQPHNPAALGGIGAAAGNATTATVGGVAACQQQQLYQQTQPQTQAFVSEMLHQAQQQQQQYCTLAAQIAAVPYANSDTFPVSQQQPPQHQQGEERLDS